MVGSFVFQLVLSIISVNIWITFPVWYFPMNRTRGLTSVSLFLRPSSITLYLVPSVWTPAAYLLFGIFQWTEQEHWCQSLRQFVFPSFLHQLLLGTISADTCITVPIDFIPINLTRSLTSCLIHFLYPSFFPSTDTLYCS